MGFKDGIDMQQAQAWLEAMEAGRLNPPRTVGDAAAWDTYWRNHLNVGLFEQGFSDMMSSDAHLIDLLAARGVRTILCVGNGVSQEPIALAVRGFHVTVLDISAIATEALSATVRHHALGIPGARVTEHTIVFDQAVPTDSEICSPIHRGSNQASRAGGTLTFATGDLMMPDVCPGPFDAVIERRTVQLFPVEARASALERLAARVGDRGVLVSQHHLGMRKPGDGHYASDLVEALGFTLSHDVDAEGSQPRSRLAYLRSSSG